MTDATAMSGDDLNFVQRIRRDYSPLVIAMVGLFLVVFVAGATLTDDFLTWFNVKTIIRDAALVGIMAIGLTFVTLSGNFFLLSMKEIAALSIICFATLMGAEWNQWGPADGDPTVSALMMTFLVALAATILPSLHSLRRDVTDLRERMARLEGLFEGFTGRTHTDPAE